MKKLLLFVAAIMIAATTFAQVNEVTLTVIGTGVNEEQATLQALRSAIEQSFGTFVSANTTILNDKLIQDEIVSVSNGNVKEYKKLAVATLPNNQVSVSLTATVSINKLISYAKSKGSRAEFAGQTYAANAKLIRLKAQSTEKAIKLMTQQLEQISKDMFDFEIQLSKPVLRDINPFGKVYYFDCNINIKSNIASTNFFNLFHKTIENLTLSPQEIELGQNENLSMINLDRYDAVPRLSKEDIFDGVKYGSGSVLPISPREYLKYDNRIRNAILNAFYRCSISEIGNPSNSYEFQQCSTSDGCPAISIATSARRPAKKGEYLLYSKKWGKLIYPSDGWIRDKFRLELNTYPNEKKFYSTFALTEVKTPIKLSKKEQKQVAKGTFTGPTYTSSYSNPKVIGGFDVRIVIPANSIESFQGFELKY